MDVQPIQQFKAFPFDTDQQYQAGLQSILQNGALDGKNESEREEFLLNTRIYYFNRLTGLSLTVDEVQESVQVRASTETQSQASVNTQTEAPHASSEPRALSFAEIKELIEQGKTDQIPNNRVIPDELSTSPPSQSTVPVRKKPWET